MILLVLALELLAPEACEADDPASALIVHIKALWAAERSTP